MARLRNKLVHGVGVNDADYCVVNGHGKNRWCCKIYESWAHMLQRCYSLPFQENNKTYIGCSVDKEWHSFMNFKAWAELQDHEGNHLDKDILFYGNKVYSKEKCVFVDPMTNTFINEYSNGRGKYMIGADLHAQCSRFRSRCSNPFTGENEYLGLYKTELEAHMAWKSRKLELAVMLANLQSDERVARALISRYS